MAASTQISFDRHTEDWRAEQGKCVELIREHQNANHLTWQRKM
jgi:hypothetical protein